MVPPQPASAGEVQHEESQQAVKYRLSILALPLRALRSLASKTKVTGLLQVFKSVSTCSCGFVDELSLQPRFLASCWAIISKDLNENSTSRNNQTVMGKLLGWTLSFELWTYNALTMDLQYMISLCAKSIEYSLGLWTCLDLFRTSADRMCCAL